MRSSRVPRLATLSTLEITVLVLVYYRRALFFSQEQVFSSGSNSKEVAEQYCKLCPLYTNKKEQLIGSTVVVFVQLKNSTDMENESKKYSDKSDCEEESEKSFSIDDTKPMLSKAPPKTEPIDVNLETPCESSKSNLTVSSCTSSSSSLLSGSQNEENLKNEGTYFSELKNEDTDSVLPTEKVITRILPKVNVAERIILCIDISEDPDFTPFKLGDGTKYSPLYMVKRISEIFMYSKSIMDKNHQFALVVMQNDATWMRDFTSNPREIVTVMEDLSEVPQTDAFNLTSLFDVIEQNVVLPEVSDLEIIPPPYVVRTVLLYNRSYCMPEFTYGRQAFDKLVSSHYFTLDVLYIHEPASERNKCEEIYNVLCDLDEKGFSYVFEVSRNATKLHDCMAKLLGHPLQRPIQKNAYYKLNDACEA